MGARIDTDSGKFTEGYWDRKDEEVARGVHTDPFGEEQPWVEWQ